VLVTRLYNDAAGESHFEDVEVALADGGPMGLLSAPTPTKSIIFRETDAAYNCDWHNAPCRQYIITLDGAAEIETSDGERRVFGRGAVVLAEDTQGRGHRTRAVDGKPRTTIFVVLDWLAQPVDSAKHGS
jgi:hypothetical protein